MKYNIGEKVRVTYGPFKNYSGQITHVGSDGLVQVSLDLIGQGLIATFLPFELEPYQENQENKFI